MPAAKNAGAGVNSPCMYSWFGRDQAMSSPAWSGVKGEKPRVSNITTLKNRRLAKPIHTAFRAAARPKCSARMSVHR